MLGAGTEVVGRLFGPVYLFCVGGMHTYNGKKEDLSGKCNVQYMYSYENYGVGESCFDSNGNAGFLQGLWPG